MLDGTAARIDGDDARARARAPRSSSPAARAWAARRRGARRLGARARRRAVERLARGRRPGRGRDRHGDRRAAVPARRDAGAGCASVTQFIGLVPPGRAPDHFHTYDEVIYVLDGEGTLYIGGEEAELRPGTCVHLPARLVHCLANTGETRDARCSASSGRPARRPRPTTPTAHPPSHREESYRCRRIERTAEVSLGRERRPRRGADHGRDRRVHRAPVLAADADRARSEGKTSPEELLAAAHAGCLTMSLASELTEAGTPPTRLDVTCTIVMDEVEGQGHQIVASHVTISAAVDGASDETSPQRSTEPTRAARSRSCSSAQAPRSRSAAPEARISSRARRGPAAARRTVAGVSERWAGKRDRAHAVGLVDDVEPERGGERERLVDRLHRSGGDAGGGERVAPTRPACTCARRSSSAARSASRFATRSSFVAKRSSSGRPTASASRANCASFPAQIISSPSRGAHTSRTARCSDARCRARPAPRRSRASPVDWFASSARFACSRSIVTRWPRPVSRRAYERGEHGDRRVERGHDVDDRDAGLRRRAGRAGDAHQAAERLHERVVAGQRRARALAEAADLAVHDARIDGSDSLVVETEALQRARQEVRDDDVGALAQRARELEIGLGLQVEHDRALVAVRRVVIRRRGRGRPAAASSAACRRRAATRP